MKIFINPGHCVGLDIGYDVKVFQADDLAEIVDVSNYWDSDLFVSIQNQIVSRLGTVDRGITNYVGGF